MKKKILLIDDDSDFSEAITMLLDSKGYQVIGTHTGEDGFNKAKSEQPDLILLDVMMSSDTEGFDISRKLHLDDQTRNIPVILVTGIRREMNLSFSFEPDDEILPVREVLEKPVKPEVLIKAIENNIK